MKKILLGAVAAIGLFAAGAGSASAAQITGNLNLYGDFQGTANGTSTQDLSTANGIDFLPLGGGSGNLFTGVGNGDLAAFAGVLGGSIKDFTFSPFSAITSFYTVTNGGSTLTFDLSSLVVTLQNSNFLNMMGTGTLSIAGFDPTPGTWNFSGQSSNGTSATATFSWSAGSAATTVPEPAALWLLGLGLLATGVARARKNKAVLPA